MSRENGGNQTLYMIAGGVFSFNTAGNVGRAFGPTVSGQLLTAKYNAGDSKWYIQ